MVDSFIIFSGNDIPFIEGGFIIHQPTLREIGLIGEENFYTGCEFLKFSKELLNDEDKNNLIDKTDFDILMIILQEKNNISIKGRVCLEMIFSLIFPKYNIKFEQGRIVLSDNNNNIFYIDNNNFIEFKELINIIFCLQSSDNKEYNPSGDLAKKIVEKLKDRHKKLAQSDENKKRESIFQRFVSILAVGENKTITNLLDYTVYQIFDEYKRFELKMNQDMFFQAKLAGAKNLQEVDNWMEDIHSTKKEK